MTRVAVTVAVITFIILIDIQLAVTTWCCTCFCGKRCWGRGLLKHLDAEHGEA